MKQAVITAPGTIEIRSVDPPELQAGQVLLRVRRVGICGSDVHVYHGTHPYQGFPMVQGHEFSATIEAVGEGVEGLSAGQKVTALPQTVCGQCPPCRRGDFHICNRLRVDGFGMRGAAQELYAVSADRIVPLPEEFSFEQGAFVEPVAVAVHAVEQAGEVAGRNVAVVGAGPIGNLTAQAARAAGADCLLSDVSAFRLDVARRCGFEHVSRPAEESLRDAGRRVFGDRGIDVAFDCAGAAASIDSAVRAVNKGGTIVVVAVFAEPAPVNLSRVQNDELTIRGTMMYWRDDYARAIEAIRSGRIDTAPLDSRHFPLEEFAAAYEFIEHAGPEAMKVFIDV
ncbi:MAG TPA: alcohol dehydrogenase catalytic domain-containing protein [Phycisphaerae bacterium]|nr:alcohol dehydrogenase catalytic domain-containing protein [Phycisphaerae bacterium]